MIFYTYMWLRRDGTPAGKHWKLSPETVARQNSAKRKRKDAQ